MKTITAFEAATHFEKFLKAARHEPVAVTQKGQPVGIMLAIQDIEILKKAMGYLDDYYWGKKAIEAKNEGFIGIEASEALMTDILNAEN